MRGYKAFKKGMVCRDKQYAENTVFEEPEANICENGMHFCKEPLDVLGYYPLVDENGYMSEFAEVEALDECKTDDNKKFCTKKLKIGAKLSFAKLVQASVDFEWEKTKGETLPDNNNSYYARIGSSGNYAQIGSSGNYARIGSSGDDARIGSSGDDARIGSSGYGARIGSSGYGAQIESTGKHSVICCAGDGCVAKGKIGSWITLSEWKWSDKEQCVIPICVKTKKIDGVKIKEDTFYKLVNGKFIEVD